MASKLKMGRKPEKKGKAWKRKEHNGQERKTKGTRERTTEDGRTWNEGTERKERVERKERKEGMERTGKEDCSMMCI